MTDEQGSVPNSDTAETAQETTGRVSTTGDVEVSTYLEIASEGVRGPGLGPRREAGNARAAAAHEAIAVVDFGSQYSRLIARRIREQNVYCEIIPPDATRDSVKDLDLRGIVLSGGPASVYDEGAPLAPAWVFDSGVPVLGICYGMQLIAHQLGGRVAPAGEREYGFAVIQRNDKSVLFDGLDDEIPVWMSHGDRIDRLPAGFRSVAYSENSPIAAASNDAGVYGIQFHPEVAHTPQGAEILRNFVFKVCGVSGSWTPGNFVAEAIAMIRRQVGDGKVICALSGGVDSAVTAKLVYEAVGSQLTCIFVNNGLLRREEPERVRDVFQRTLALNLIYVDASERFLTALAGVSDPERKRKVIGAEFINVFEEQAQTLGEVDFLAQGTLYPDVIESQTSENTAAHKIKTHHNVGGLPERMKLQLVEPFALPVSRTRCGWLAPSSACRPRYSTVSPSRVQASRSASSATSPMTSSRCCGRLTGVVMDEIKRDGLYDKLWQSFAVLTDTRTVGVMGDVRTYQHVVALRAVTSEDAMTADWARLPYETLGRISNRIVNEVPSVNRVVYDVTSKPPGTIEWE